MSKISKVIHKIGEKEQKEATILRRFANIDPYFYRDMILKLVNDNDRYVYINPKPKQKDEKDGKHSSFYAFKDRDYTKLNQVLDCIAIKETTLKNRGRNMEGLKSFNRNVWLDFSRQSNAIEGIIDDFSYDLLSFRVQLREQIDTDPDKDKPFDKYEYYKKLMRKCEELKENHSKNNGIIVIEGKKKKHSIGVETLRHFIAFKYAYRCAKYDKMQELKNIDTNNHELQKTEFIELISNVHSLIFGRETAFRTTPIYVNIAKWVPPSEDEYFSQLEHLSNWVLDRKVSGSLNPIEKTAIFHAEYVRIHPFMDGNGRSGRILSNYFLIKDEMPTVSIGYKETQKYFDAVNKAILTHDINDLIDIYYEGVLNGTEKIIANIDYIEKEHRTRKTIEKDSQL